MAILLALRLVAAGLSLDVGSASRQPALAAGASGVVGVNTGSGRVATAAPLTGAPAGVCTDSGSLWVADASDGTVSRIDPTTGAPSTGPGRRQPSEYRVWRRIGMGREHGRGDCPSARPH